MDSGKSLRQKRGAGKLKISQPTLISAPQSATSTTISIKEAAAAQQASRPSAAGTAASRRDGLPGALKPGGVPGAVPVPRSRQKSATDQTADLVKRRYSTRFTNMPQDYSEVPPMPDIPAMPTKFALSASNDMGDGRRKIPVDTAKLNDPNLDAESFVSSVLFDAPPPQIEQYLRDLQKVKATANAEIQQSVFQNRTQFIKISKEAEKLKTELRNLRSLMTELTGTMGQVAVSGVSAGSSNSFSLGSGGRNRGNRSSVANLEALWNSHLQELWRRVEGSQKYLPAIPGRHVVYESSRWVELNSATWKPRRKVHLILLNDHLLIATEKKRPEGQREGKDKQQTAQFVALKCWPLQDVQMADIAMRVTPGTGDMASSSHSINIRVGPESLTFATANKEGHEKLSLLSNFRKSSEDLRRKLDSENQDQDRNKESTDGLISPLFNTAFGDVFTGSKSDFLVEVDGNPQSLRWVEMQIDDLDIDSALQKHEEAIVRIEKLRGIVKSIRTNPTAQKTLNAKLDDRAAKLALTISRNLSETHSWMSVTEKNVNWLFRLGFQDRAREAYLEARSAIIQKRVRQVIFDGDLHLYIYQISFIFFTIIKHSALIFQACFPASMLSACVKWAKGHVDDFNALLQRQLSSVDSSSETYKACMERAHEHAAMLSEVGLDFKDLVGNQDA